MVGFCSSVVRFDCWSEGNTCVGWLCVRVVLCTRDVSVERGQHVQSFRYICFCINAYVSRCMYYLKKKSFCDRACHFCKQSNIEFTLLVYYSFPDSFNVG